jgi:hypothetical protein
MLNSSKIITRLCHSDRYFRTTFPSFVNIKYIGPSCSDCIYFVTSITGNPSHSKCGKFTKLNSITKQIVLSYAYINRQQSDLCGPSAKYKESISYKVSNPLPSDDKVL